MPFQDRMDLQDALKSCGWSVQTAMEKIRSDAKVINVASQKFGSFQPKRERLRDHEVTGILFAFTYNYCTANSFLEDFIMLPPKLLSPLAFYCTGYLMAK
jgi:hypothetical protein